MNQIDLRGRPANRLLYVALFAAVAAVCLLPAFVEIDFGFTNRVKREVYEVYKTAGPYYGVFLLLIALIPFRRFLLGKPIFILSRDGVEACMQPVVFIPWAHIDAVDIKRVRFVKRLVIRRKADTIPPSRWTSVLSAPFVLNAGPHLYVPQFHIDRPLRHVKHWIDEGRRNAAAGVTPDPFFTVPY